jgi:hypothetical protein
VAAIDKASAAVTEMALAQGKKPPGSPFYGHLCALVTGADGSRELEMTPMTWVRFKKLKEL